MDPLTAALNAYTKTLDLIITVWNSMTDAQKQKIINDWQSTQDFWKGVIENLSKGNK